MKQCVTGKNWAGTVRAKASKSFAHRQLICAALGRNVVRLTCRGLSKDIEATVDCLNAMGARISVDGDVITVRPLRDVPEGLCDLRCGESGSTLRFLVPVVGALGIQAVFRPEGRLPERPMEPLEGQLAAGGMTFLRQGSDLFVSGKLAAGAFRLPGNVSSQYVTGLLLALPLLDGDSVLTVEGKRESESYVDITKSVLRESGIRWMEEDGVYRIPGGQRFALSPEVTVEGDWSNAAFWLCAGALLPGGLTVEGLNGQSCQGDRKILEVLRRFGAGVEESESAVTVRRGALKGIVLDASDIPDLVPVISVVAAGAEGQTRIEHAERLRLKESDRIQSTVDFLTRLGADGKETADGLIIEGKQALQGGGVSSWGDHRIAMAAAVAALLCREPVAIEGAEAVAKSYPGFWEDLRRLTEEECS